MKKKPKTVINYDTTKTKKKGSPTAIYDDDSGRRIVGIGRLFVFICLCERDSQAAQGGQVMSPLTASS